MNFRGLCAEIAVSFIREFFGAKRIKQLVAQFFVRTPALIAMSAGLAFYIIVPAGITAFFRMIMIPSAL